MLGFWGLWGLIKKVYKLEKKMGARMYVFFFSLRRVFIYSPKSPKSPNMIILFYIGWLSLGTFVFQKSPAHRWRMDFNEYLARVRQAEAAQQALSHKAASPPVSLLAAVLPSDDGSKNVCIFFSHSGEFLSTPQSPQT
jgi:hypothetical protein